VSNVIRDVVDDINKTVGKRWHGLDPLLPELAAFGDGRGMASGHLTIDVQPGKPLALIAGKPLIQHVVEQCQRAKSLSEIIVATDDTRIWEVAQNFCRVEMTRPEHPSGSDRIAEVADGGVEVAPALIRLAAAEAGKHGVRAEGHSAAVGLDS